MSSKRDKPTHDTSYSKKDNSIDLSHIEHLNASSNVNITLTPNTKDRKSKEANVTVKPIIKNNSALDNSAASMDTPRSKKRNKSVSFMLNDNEETAVKKIKSNENSSLTNSLMKNKTKTYKNDKNKKKVAEKENNEINARDIAKNIKSCDFAPNDSMENNLEAKKKFRKNRKHNKSENVATSDTKNKKRHTSESHPGSFETTETSIDSPDVLLTENLEDQQRDSNNSKKKDKKAKKQKRSHKQSENIETEFTDTEPKKSRKKESKAVPEIIAKDLENLNIGDNAHTLTDLLDEMTVSNKNKKKKSKGKIKTGKTKEPASPNSTSIEPTDLENQVDGEKEKVPWKKRKWNKDKKVEAESLLTSVIVEDLPLKIIFDFKKILMEHFSKLGPVKSIGVAEVYPSVEPRPVFTTTVHFYSEEVATQAVAGGGCGVAGGGGEARVRRPLPPRESTLVARSYAPLSDQALSSLLHTAGRVRSIRHTIKGKKSMATAFVELDGPESVRRALARAQGAALAGKKIYLDRFRTRPHDHVQLPREQ